MKASAAPRRAYRRYSPAVWQLVRRDYLKGETAPSLGERYGPSPGTIYNRSQLEGWSKKAQAEAAPVPATEEGETPSLETAREAAGAAARRAAHEMSAGRPSTASEFAKLAEVLSRVADRLEPPQSQPQAGERDVFEVLRERLDRAAAEECA